MDEEKLIQNSLDAFNSLLEMDNKCGWANSEKSLYYRLGNIGLSGKLEQLMTAPSAIISSKSEHILKSFFNYYEPQDGGNIEYEMFGSFNDRQGMMNQNMNAQYQFGNNQQQFSI